MIASSNSSESEREYAASTGGFLIFGSVLFLLERLGTPEPLLGWALVSAALVISALFGFSGRTTSAPEYFCSTRSEGAAGLTISGSASILSVPLFLLIVFFQPLGPVPIISLIAIAAAGYGLSGWLFASPFRKSGAYSVADYLGFRFNSKPVRFLVLTGTAIAGFSLLFAELRLAGLYLAPMLKFSFEQVNATIVVFAAFAGLVGGVASVLKMQSALVLLIILTVILPAMWLALILTGIPLPQMVISFSEPALPVQILVDIRLAKELEFAVGLVEKPGLLLPALLFLGTLSLPQATNRSFSAQSARLAKKAHLRSVLLILILLTSIPALYYVLATNAFESGNAAVAMPLILRIFVPVAVLMIAVSSTSQLLSIIANTLSHDGYQLVRPGRVPPTRQIFAARIIIILTAYGAWYCSIHSGFSPISALIWGFGLSAACLLPALLASLYWGGVSKFTVLLGTGTGIVVMMASFFALETETGGQLVQTWFSTTAQAVGYSNITAGMVSLAANVIMMFIATPFFRADKDGKQRMKKLQDKDKEILISANL